MTKPLFDVFRESMLHNPDGSRKEAQDHFIEAMKSDPAYLDMLARDYFERMAAVWTVRHDKLGHSFARTEVSEDKNERIREALINRAAPPAASPAPPEQIELARRKREESAARTAQAFDELKAKVRNIILLDLELPNGKKLRNATGAECKKAGGFYAEVAKHLRPTQVVDRHMSEADLQNIKSRFFQANVA